jgi:hypothetical protein
VVELEGELLPGGDRRVLAVVLAVRAADLGQLELDALVVERRVGADPAAVVGEAAVAIAALGEAPDTLRRSPVAAQLALAAASLLSAATTLSIASLASPNSIFVTGL